MEIRNKASLLHILLCFLLFEPLWSQNKEQKSTYPNTIHYWTIFDSFGASGQWQKTFSQLSGWTFHSGNEDPMHPISYGGTNSTAKETAGSLVRTINLVKCHGNEPVDVIFFENVNDIHICSANNKPYGSVKDSPWMPKEHFTIHSLFESRSKAEKWLQDSLSIILKDVPEQVRNNCNILDIPYKNQEGSGTRIKIVSTAKKEGTFIIKIDGAQYGITVTPQMSIQNIIDKMTEWNYGPGWADYDNGDGSITLSFWTKTNQVVSFEDNGTGVEAVLSDETKTSALCYYFTGSSVIQWEDILYWNNSISLYSCYKGMFSYLKEEFPEAKIYLFIPTYYNLDFSDKALRNPDGSFNEDAVNNLEISKKWVHLKEFWQEIANECGIETIDIETKSGINLSNVEQYYNTNDVHPKQAGYDKWAQTLHEILIEMMNIGQIHQEDSYQDNYSIDGLKLSKEKAGQFFIKGNKKIYKLPY